MKTTIITAYKKGQNEPAIVDCPSNKAVDVDKIKRDLFKVGYDHVIVETNYPAYCPNCGVMADVSPAEHSSITCMHCANVFRRNNHQCYGDIISKSY